MAIGALVVSELVPQSAVPVAPVSLNSKWKQVVDDCEASDNSGNTVVQPLAISRAEQHWIDCGIGTTLEFCMGYTRGASPSDLVVQPFGCDRLPTATGAIPQRLLTMPGGSNEFTLVDAATDADDGTTWEYTDSQEVDLRGNRYALLAIKTAVTLTGSAVLFARVK